ncbi:uncharacterized protein LOC143695705 [Agelaius phoeniceus]|uniref:uncharacterized protein LOC143695705 n=1 Tax=Agelaius phoeniceus TaxID=39638 RepID=UPI004054FC43
MIFLDRQKMFGAVKLSCSPLTFVLTFFQTQKDKIQGKIHPPIPSKEVSPEQEVKLDIGSQNEVGKAIHSEYAEPQSPTGRRTGCAALSSPAEESRDSLMKPLPFLFKGVTRVALGTGRGVTAYPVTTPSISERGQRVRPQEPGIIRRTLTKKQQEAVEQQCQQELPRC